MLTNFSQGVPLCVSFYSTSFNHELDEEAVDQVEVSFPREFTDLPRFSDPRKGKEILFPQALFHLQDPRKKGCGDGREQAPKVHYALRLRAPPVWGAANLSLGGTRPHYPPRPGHANRVVPRAQQSAVQ